MARRIATRGVRRAALYLALAILNCALFVPAYVCSVPEAQRWPAWSEPGLGAGLLALLVRRDNQDVFRIAIDFALLLLALIWSADTRARAWVRRCAVAVYGFLWLFLAYHHAVGHWFQRTPALLEDVRLGLNLLHFLGSFSRASWFLDWAILGGFVVALWLTARCFGALQRPAAGWSVARRGWISVALVAPAALSCSVHGVASDRPVFQVTSKRVYDNLRASAAEAALMAAVHAAAPDTRYDEYLGVRWTRKPDVYLVMMEAYGEILATWDMAPAYRELLARVEGRLSRAGYHAATAYSTAPVHGGTSWFSIATVLTGVFVHRPKAHALVEQSGLRIPTLPRFFREQGYLSHALQPGSTQRTGLKRNDYYGHERAVDAISIDYRGKPYGWGRIPDQYALGVFRERYFQPSAGPRYAFFMNVSTHYPWSGLPPYVRDWKTLASAGAVPTADLEGWPALRNTSRIGTALRRNYFESIAYEWRVLSEWFESEADKDNVIVVLGDHQPRLEWNLPGAVTLNTPMHILSKDRALIERFIQQGFEPGLYATPERRPPLQHAGLFSLLISQLTAHLSPTTPGLPLHPKGAPLPALKR